MSARDLVRIGSFAALYLVTVFVFVLIGFTNPFVMLVSVPVSIVAAGIVFLLFLAKVQHAGMVFSFALIFAALHLATGHPAVGFPLTVAVGLIAEVVLWLGHYRATWSRILAYAVFSIWTGGPWLPLFIDRQAFLTSERTQRMGADYVAQLQGLTSPVILMAMVLIAFVAGLLGGLLGVSTLRRHFRPAGVA